MYNTHQITIEKWAKENPENMFKTIKFVIATAHRKFAYVPYVLRTDYGFSNGQLDSLEAIYAMRNTVYETIMHQQNNEVELMRYIVTLPHLGTVKGGFLAQLVTGQVGCLDTWNQVKHGIKASAYTIDKKLKEQSVTRKLHAYIAKCKELGGSEVLWDTWCGYLADQFKPGSKEYPWETAEQVSAFHVEACIR